MRPYYDHAGITIYHGDCRDVIAGLDGVDLVVTDPPYGMAFQSNYRAVAHAPIVGDDALPVEAIKLAISQARRAAYVFGRWDNLPAMPPPQERPGMGQKQLVHG